MQVLGETEQQSAEKRGNEATAEERFRRVTSYTSHNAPLQQEEHTYGTFNKANTGLQSPF